MRFSFVINACACCRYNPKLLWKLAAVCSNVHKLFRKLAAVCSNIHKLFRKLAAVCIVIFNCNPQAFVIHGISFRYYNSFLLYLFLAFLVFFCKRDRSICLSSFVLFFSDKERVRIARPVGFCPKKYAFALRLKSSDGEIIR